MVSTGAAGAIAIGTYACIAGEDEARIKQLPDLSGMKDEVVIQKVHRISYDHAVRGAGVKIVEVETIVDLLEQELAVFVRDLGERRLHTSVGGANNRTPTHGDHVEQPAGVVEERQYSVVGCQLVDDQVDSL